MNITAFTKKELDYFREICNFTKMERELFELRAKECTLEECAELLHVSLSTVKRLSQKLNKKIIRVC